MKQQQVCAGIDIGGTNCQLGICNRDGDVLFSTVMATSQFPDVRSFATAAAIWLREKADENQYEIVAAGIGAPNGNYFTGNIEHAPNMDWKGIVPLANEFKKALNIDDVVVTNDANAAALGEQDFGGAKGLNNFAVITLGTGIGGGFVVNGKLLYGADGMAGEFGHITVVRGGRLCGCGRYGCVEAYASAGGLLVTAHELLEKSALHSPLHRRFISGELSCPDIVEAAREGDITACKALDETANYLAQALAGMVALLSPSHIFMYGGLALAGDVLLEPLRIHLEQQLLIHHRNRIQLLVSSLPENAAVMGAAALGWYELEKNGLMIS